MRIARLISLSALALLGSSAAPPTQAAEPPVDPKAAFETLKQLEGTWQGKAGHGQADQPATVTYRVASGGSVVQETLFPGTPHEMISMYHLADGQLVMTHYCAAGNQPHMKLDTKASSTGKLVFAFDGGTNFDPAKDGHIHSGEIRLQGDALHNEWASWAGGKENARTIFDLHRGR